jgi:hypothetical protein
MRNEVRIQLDGYETSVDLTDLVPMANDVGRWWLDDHFLRFGCEPLRPSGKVLTADKVLAVAASAGADRFKDPLWARDYARAVAAALGKPAVTVDVPTLSVNY